MKGKKHSGVFVLRAERVGSEWHLQRTFVEDEDTCLPITVNQETEL